MKLNVQRIFLLVNLLLYVPVAVLLWAGLSRKDYSANQKENCDRIALNKKQLTLFNIMRFAHPNVSTVYFLEPAINYRSSIKLWIRLQKEIFHSPLSLFQASI